MYCDMHATNEALAYGNCTYISQVCPYVISSNRGSSRGQRKVTSDYIEHSGLTSPYGIIIPEHIL